MDIIPLVVLYTCNYTYLGDGFPGKKCFFYTIKGERFITISTKNAICDTNSRLDSSSFASSMYIVILILNTDKYILFHQMPTLIKDFLAFKNQ